MPPASLLLKGLALALVLVLVVSLLQFLAAIHPPRQRSEAMPSDHGVPFEAVRFVTSDGLGLAGWWVPGPEGEERVVLVGHGYPFDKGNVLSSTLFLRERFNLVYFDHRYFGESEGRVTTVGLREVRDVEAVLDFLESRGAGPVGAVGFSLSASVFLMTEDARLEAVVAEAPYASLDAVLERQYRFLAGPLKWPFTGMTALYARVLLGAWPSEASPADAVASTGRPTLLVHGTQDKVVPFGHARQIMEGASEAVELWAVEGAGHGEAQAVAGEAYRQRILDFLDGHVGADREGKDP